MKRTLPWVGVVLSAVLAVGSAGAFAASLGASKDAHSAYEGAERLYQARLDVAEAQKKLGDSSIEDAIISARKANATAESVGVVTKRIARLLAATEGIADAITDASRRGLASTSFVRKQSGVARDILATIAAYQARATRYASINNKALGRILKALRETNDQFPGGGP
ncbi:MAG: hypothetical protein QOG54_79 [Actinomycetota bacterium]|jgi:hypothetical protein|nr:hypothetical protein [Actinomycetota bacterium]